MLEMGLATVCVGLAGGTSHLSWLCAQWCSMPHELVIAPLCQISEILRRLLSAFMADQGEVVDTNMQHCCDIVSERKKANRERARDSCILMQCRHRWLAESEVFGMSMKYSEIPPMHASHGYVYVYMACSTIQRRLSLK